MKTHNVLIVGLLSFVVVASATEFSSGINSFANKLYDVLSKNSNRNLIFSPISAHSALSLTYQGAVNETAKSFQRSLNVPEAEETASAYKDLLVGLNSNKNVQISVANKIYVKTGYKLKDRFLDVAKSYFSADAETIDFVRAAAAADRINAWVSEKTNENIKTLVTADDFDADTRAVLLNAIYFKGNWLKKFPTKATRTEKFYKKEGDFLECKMMSNIADYHYGEDEELDAKILKMRYENDKYTMTVVLPNTVSGIGDLEKKLLTKDVNSLSTNYKRVAVSFPKFKFDSTLTLKEPLKEIGLSNIFSGSADFSNMLDSTEPIVVDKVIQKAFIEVNEDGSEASAATGVVMKWRTASHHPRSPAVFKANHPFIFYITADLSDFDDDSTVLFMGKVLSID